MNHCTNSVPPSILICLAFLAGIYASAALDTQAQTSPKPKDPFQKISFEEKRLCTVTSSGEVTALVKNGVELSVSEDFDCDGVPDAYDNCVGMPNPTQADKNDDGIGDACEAATEVKKTLPAKPKSTEKPKERKPTVKPDRHSRSQRKKR